MIGIQEVSHRLYSPCRAVSHTHTHLRGNLTPMNGASGHGSREEVGAPGNLVSTAHPDLHERLEQT